MAFQVIVLPSDLTPPPAPFRQMVDDLLAASNARWVDTPDDGDLRLADGREIGLYLDEEENVAAFVLDEADEAALDLIHALAERAEAFVTLGDRACALLPTGDVLPAFEAQLRDPDDLADRRAFGDWVRAAMVAASPPPALPPRPPRPSLWRRLSDSLFGKEI